MTRIVEGAPENLPATKTSAKVEGLRALMDTYLPKHNIKNYGKFINELRYNTDLDSTFYTDDLMKDRPKRASFMERSAKILAHLKSAGRKIWKDTSGRHNKAARDFIGDSAAVVAEMPEKVIDANGRLCNMLDVPCFSTPQGAVLECTANAITYSKQRPITDQRARSHATLLRSKHLPRIALPGLLVLQAMIQWLTSGLSATYVQYRKDAFSDCKWLLGGVFKWNPRQSSYSMPWVSKLDFSQYFFTFRTVQAVRLYIFVDGVTRVFKSDRCGFGSLHSIYISCRVSAALQLILNFGLAILMVLYVDGTIILSCCPVVAQAQLFMVAGLYRALGIPLAAKKIEQQQHDLDITALGLVLRRRGPLLAFLVQEKQLVLATAMLEEGARLTREFRVAVSFVQNLTGRLLHILGIMGRYNELQLLSSVLLPFSAENWFRPNIRRRFMRKTLIFIMDRIRTLIPTARERHLWVRTGEPKALTSVTDASLSDSKSAPKIALGGYTTFSRNPNYSERDEIEVEASAFNVWHMDGVSVLFEGVDVKNDIFLYEMCAAIVNTLKNVRKFHNIIPEDGGGAIFNHTRQSSSNVRDHTEFRAYKELELRGDIKPSEDIGGVVILPEKARRNLPHSPICRNLQEPG